MTGEQLKKLREETGKSQKEFAALVGVSVNTISNYETGKTIPESKLPLFGMLKRALENEKAPEEPGQLLKEVNKKLEKVLGYLVRLDIDSNEIKEGVHNTYEELVKRK